MKRAEERASKAEPVRTYLSAPYLVETDPITMRESRFVMAPAEKRRRMCCSS
jgi:hypothetical protein